MRIANEKNKVVNFTQKFPLRPLLIPGTVTCVMDLDVEILIIAVNHSAR